MTDATKFELVRDLVFGDEEVIRSLKFGDGVVPGEEAAHVRAVDLVGTPGIEVDVPIADVDGPVRGVGNAVYDDPSTGRMHHGCHSLDVDNLPEKVGYVGKSNDSSSFREHRSEIFQIE